MNTDRTGSNIHDSYRGVVLVLLTTAALGMLAAVAGGLVLANSAILAVAITLGLASGALIGVLNAQSARTKPPQIKAEPAPPAGESETGAAGLSGLNKAALLSLAKRGISRAGQSLDDFDLDASTGAAVAAGSAIVFLLLNPVQIARPSPLAAGIAAAFLLGAAGLAAMAARYLAEIEPAQFLESQGLCRGARVAVWMLLLAAASIGAAWAKQQTLAQLLCFIILTVDAALCLGFLRLKKSAKTVPQTFLLDMGVLSVLGRRANIFAGVLDAAEQQLGIDLRSTWALTVVRRSLKPLAAGLFLAGWLSTSLTVVTLEEQGLVERWGVPLAGQPLQPGLHLHWPWPVDRVFLIPVQRVHSVQVGHEGEEKEGPENVLWAVEHAPNEYTLLLGNGRDLITVDAALQYRITNPRAWRYNCQNPELALRAIAYRAVMRSTVNLTLSQALSQNVATLTRQMRAMVQKDADALGLGVSILDFTVGGMHPPVPVAAAYEAVVSAQLANVTAVVEAKAYRNQTVPQAESSVLTGENIARAQGAQALALAAGQAWSFRALESQYRASPGEYFFRRRLETLEKLLPQRKYTVVDSRFLRDGGEIWTTQ